MKNNSVELNKSVDKFGNQVNVGDVVLISGFLYKGRLAQVVETSYLNNTDYLVVMLRELSGKKSYEVNILVYYLHIVITISTLLMRCYVKQNESTPRQIW